MGNLCDSYQHCSDGSDEAHCGMSYFHENARVTLTLFLDPPSMKGRIHIVSLQGLRNVNRSPSMSFETILVWSKTNIETFRLCVFLVTLGYM